MQFVICSQFVRFPSIYCKPSEPPEGSFAAAAKSLQSCQFKSQEKETLTLGKWAGDIIGLENEDSMPNGNNFPPKEPWLWDVLSEHPPITAQYFHV